MNHLSLLAALVAASMLGGCAGPSNPPRPMAYAQQPAEASSGVVDAIQVVRANSGNSGTGAVAGGLAGALLGNQIGSGHGRTAATVAGAVGGALVGNEVEARRSQASDSYQVSVRMDNGDYRIVNQDSARELRVGDRVHLVDGRLYRY